MEQKGKEKGKIFYKFDKFEITEAYYIQMKERKRIAK